jgi:hypothetical protein
MYVLLFKLIIIISNVCIISKIINTFEAMSRRKEKCVNSNLISCTHDERQKN